MWEEALPLGNGHVGGLVARGSFVVDMDWREGKLTKARILSRTGALLKLRTNVLVTVTGVGAKMVVSKVYDQAQYLTSFETKAGKTYEIVAQ